MSLSPDLVRSMLPPLREIAGEAGELALRSFRRGEHTLADVRFKAGNSPVTAADLAVDALLRTRLSALFGEAGWLSEETTDDGARLDRRHVWVVDPIDGTRAFMTGDPDWSVAIALVSDGAPVLGLVAAPAHPTLYEADRGGGARRDGRRITVSAAGPSDRLRVTGPKPLFERIRPRFPTAEAAPRIPSLALRIARVAEGAVEIGLVSRDSHDWDIAGADLILREAGGALLGLDGRPPSYNELGAIHGELVAAARPLADDLVTALASR